MNVTTIRFGIVGLEGHGPVFAGHVNGEGADVEDARVTAAVTVPSALFPPDVLAAGEQKARDLGIEIVDAPEALADKVDAILVLHDNGSRHLEDVRRLAPLGKPLFIDKPLEASAAKAAELVRVCAENGCPVFSASSLRFSVEIQEALAGDGDGPIASAVTWSPFGQRPEVPGWFYYGVHAVEPLYTLMGTGCREVRCVRNDEGAVAVGLWNDGRLGVARAINTQDHGFGFTVWRERSTRTAVIDTSKIYPELLKRVRSFAATGVSPVDPAESVEGMAFLQAANESMATGGEPVTVSA